MGVNPIEFVEFYEIDNAILKGQVRSIAKIFNTLK